MLGPVLYLELLLAGRRGKQHVFRWVYAAWLVLQFLVLYVIYRSQVFLYGLYRSNPNATGDFALGFVGTLLVQEWILVALVTPAFVAGAITDEKNRGTLQHLLTAHLTSGEIVAGKLLGRLFGVAVLMLVDLPLLCFIGAFGGIHPVLLLAILIGMAAPMFGIGAASVLASVWCRNTRDAVIFLYALGAVFWLLVVGLFALLPGITGGLAAGPARGLLGLLHMVVSALHPLEVLRPAFEDDNMPEVGRRLLRAVFAWGTIGLVCLGLATWRLRPAYFRQLQGSQKKGRSASSAGPVPVDEEPIRWKERNLEGIAPLAVLRTVPQWVGITLVALVTLLASAAALWRCMKPRSVSSFADIVALLQSADPVAAGAVFWVQGVVVLLIGTLIVGIRAAGAVSGEREKQTWDALLLTPLQTHELVRGKLSGIFAASVPYLVAYAVVALPLAGLGGLIALFWTALWLGITALGVYYIGAAGIWSSARSSSSWRSLVGTLGFGYVGGFLVYVVMSPITFIVAGIIFVILNIADHMYGTMFTRAVGSFGAFEDAFYIASCVALALMFFIASRLFLRWAESGIASRERIRHWKEEPFRRSFERHPAMPRSRLV